MTRKVYNLVNFQGAYLRDDPCNPDFLDNPTKILYLFWQNCSFTLRGETCFNAETIAKVNTLKGTRGLFVTEGSKGYLEWSSKGWWVTFDVGLPDECLSTSVDLVRDKLFGKPLMVPSLVPSPAVPVAA